MAFVSEQRLVSGGSYGYDADGQGYTTPAIYQYSQPDGSWGSSPYVDTAAQQAEAAAAEKAKADAAAARQSQLSQWLNQAQSYKPANNQPANSAWLKGGIMSNGMVNLPNGGLLGQTSPSGLSANGINYGSGLLGMQQRNQQVQQITGGSQ